MINFGIIRKKPDEIELRAYLYQLIKAGFGLSYNIVESLKEEFPALTEKYNQWELTQVSINRIKHILEQNEIYPNEIFFFKQDYGKTNAELNNYKLFPDIYTAVLQVSFDKGGLIVMECFKSQISQLFNSKAKQLTEYCHDLDIGIDGLVLLRKSSNDSGFWSLYNYDGNSLNYGEEELFDSLDPLTSYFPSIEQRDIIPEMFPIGEFPIPDNYPPTNITKEDLAKELAQNEYNYRYLSSYYFDNNELALLAVNSNKLAFTLLSPDLQNSKDFVLESIKRNENNQFLYPYLNKSLQKVLEIVKLCVTENPSIILNLDKPISDQELLLLAIETDYSMLKYATEDLLNSKDFMYNAVRVNGLAILYASEELKNSKALAIEAVKNNGFALEHIPDKLKDDKDVVLEAVKSKKHAIRYASTNLQNNKDFIKLIDNQNIEYDNDAELPF